MPYCPNCGAEISRGTRFCPQCGTSVTSSPSEIHVRSDTRLAKAGGDLTSKPIVAGILAIIAGVIMIAVDLIVLDQLQTATSGIFGIILNWFNLGGVITDIQIAIAVAVVLAIVAIAGGICALKRKVWGLALAGSICILLSAVFILGIVAIVLIVSGKSEFN
jgi:hypothetical protein